MELDVLRQLWPVFSAEAREHLDTIGAGVLELERGDADSDRLATIRRAAHSLKGSASSLGFGDLEQVAHAVEDALAGMGGAARLAGATVEAILAVLSAAQESLEHGPAGVKVEGLDDLLATVRAGATDATARESKPARKREGGRAVARTAQAAAVSTPEPAPEPPAAHEAPSPAAARAADAETAEGDRAIRVSSGAIDTVSRHVEILALGERRAARRARELLALARRVQQEARAGDGSPSSAAFARELSRIAQEAHRDAARQGLDAATLRGVLRDLRMVPAATALEPLRRTVRETAGRLHKQVELHIQGGDIRLDRRVLQHLESPLVHLVRNAIDHGIEAPERRRAAGKPEAGRLEIRVESRGRRVGLVVGDDGAGLSRQRILDAAVSKGLVAPERAATLGEHDTYRLLFTPGFSTASRVTAVSGRGVGLDVVQDAVTRLQGTVQVSSVLDLGTSFDLDLPLTLASTTTMLCRVAGDLVAVPVDAVERVLRLKPADLGTTAGQVMARVGSSQVAYTTLAQVLGMPRPGGPPAEAQPALLLAFGGRRMVLAVDEVLSEQEMIVTSLGRMASAASTLAGVAVLDDGGVVGVLNPSELLRHSEPAVAESVARPPVLIADDSLTTRSAMKTVLELAGYSVLAAADGEEAWELLAMRPVELVVTDVQMPRLDGLALTRRIKADPALRRLPVVLVTSLDTPEDRLAGLEAGADAYLVKREVESGRLLELVQQLMPGPS